MKRSPKIFCVFGKYNYGDPGRGLGYEYSNFIPALKRLGYEIAFFDNWDRALFQNFYELNKALLYRVKREQPDIMFSTLIHYEIWRQTLCLLRDSGSVATVNWATDDSWRYESFSRLVAPAFHAFTTTDSDAYAKYQRDGIKNVLLTQWAANSATLQEPLPAAKCTYAVSFIGSAHGDRPRWIAALRQRGIEIVCFGHGWDRGPVASEDIPGIIRTSWISLNFANSALSWESLLPRKSYQIKARVFEVPGAGGFLLTQWVDGLDRWYIPGQEICVFHGPDDLAERIRYYLAHPAMRDAIAWAGFERTRVEHTYDHRLPHVLEFALKCRDAYLAQANAEKRDWSDALQFETIAKQHRVNILLAILRRATVQACSHIWGPQRGPRAARRLFFELSWRLVGARTYTSAGWPGRMFYEVS